MQAPMLAPAGHPPRRAARPWSAWSAPLVAIGLVFAWVAVAALCNPAQYGDSIEQYNWAHGLELGYWKHPPLPTWIMRGAIALVGAGPWTSYLLAALCAASTALFTWRIGLMLLPERTAALAVMLLPLHHGLSWRAQVYNHNTVLLLAASAMVWATLRAQRRGTPASWALAGVLAGLAMLSKYQALVPILALLAGLAWTGGLRQRAVRQGVLVAGGCAALVFAPHLGWAWAHGVPSLGYLEQSAGHAAAGSEPLRLASFLAVQVGVLFSMLLAAGVALAWPRRAGAARHAVHAAHAVPAADCAAAGLPAPVRTQRWLLCLVLLPLLAVLGAIAAGGLQPQKWWGLQTLQFFPLLLAWLLHRRRPALPTLAPAGLALAIGLGSAGWYAHDTAHAQAQAHSLDRLWPAVELAREVREDWEAETACPLGVIVGPAFPAGLVSVYSGSWPLVLEDGNWQHSPWVQASELPERGAVMLHGPVRAREVPPGMSTVDVPGPGEPDQHWQVWWEIRPPQAECEREPARDQA